MARPPKFDRDDALRRAMYLFWERGFDRTSINDLTAAMKPAPELVLDLGDSDPVTTERPTFNMIFDNLLSNAIRYRDDCKPAQTIRIATRRNQDQLMVAVSDNGVGIPARGLPQVFEMFKRIDERSGDGMGLSLVRKQIERLGGTITVTSTEGVGAEFRFVLPLPSEATT